MNLTTGTIESDSENTTRASVVYEYAHASVASFITLFEEKQRARGNKRGILSDMEQDLLRAALTFACAGLDSVLKHLIKDCLQDLVGKDMDVESRFVSFIERKISPTDTGKESWKFLSRILSKPNLRGELIEEYISSLVGSSLQSEEEVFRVCTALGINSEAVGLRKGSHRFIFGIRNEVIHEMDIDLNARPRKRIMRSKSKMIEAINKTLELSKKIVLDVDGKLKK